jgi:hypothetical protein
VGTTSVGWALYLLSGDGRAYVYNYDRTLSDLFLVTDLQ